MSSWTIQFNIPKPPKQERGERMEAPRNGVVRDEDQQGEQSILDELKEKADDMPTGGVGICEFWEEY